MTERNRATRRQDRLVKGARRVHEDRAQHGADHTCSCFDPIGKGKTFARFADHPAVCSNPDCCGNPRKSPYSEADGLPDKNAAPQQ